MGDAEQAGKMCLRCRAVLPLESFPRHRRHPDGRFRYCKPCKAALQRHYREDPEYRERERQTAQLSRLRRRDWRAAYAWAWRMLHPDRARVQAQLRQQRLRLAGGEMGPEAWETLKQTWGYRCAACGLPEDGEIVETRLQADHVIPVAMGGSSSVWNRQPLCGICNARKGATHRDFRDCGDKPDPEFEINSINVRMTIMSEKEREKLNPRASVEKALAQKAALLGAMLRAAEEPGPEGPEKTEGATDERTPRRGMEEHGQTRTDTAEQGQAGMVVEVEANGTATIEGKSGEGDGSAGGNGKGKVVSIDPKVMERRLVARIEELSKDLKWWQNLHADRRFKAVIDGYRRLIADVETLLARVKEADGNKGLVELQAEIKAREDLLASLCDGPLDAGPLEDAERALSEFRANNALFLVEKV